MFQKGLLAIENSFFDADALQREKNLKFRLEMMEMFREIKRDRERACDSK